MKAMDAVRKLTGTTDGATPVFDGTMRGSLVALLNAAIALSTVSDWVDAEQAVVIALMVNPFVFFVFGLWDAFWKARTRTQQMLSDYKTIVGDIHESVEPDAHRANTQFGSVSETFGAGDLVAGTKPPTVGEAMKRVRLTEDSRITPAVEKKKQPRDASGRYGSKPKRKK